MPRAIDVLSFGAGTVELAPKKIKYINNDHVTVLVDRMGCLKAGMSPTLWCRPGISAVVVKLLRTAVRVVS